MAFKNKGTLSFSSMWLELGSITLDEINHDKKYNKPYTEKGQVAHDCTHVWNLKRLLFHSLRGQNSGH